MIKIDKKLEQKWEDYLCELFDFNEDEVIEYWFNKEVYEEFLQQL